VCNVKWASIPLDGPVPPVSLVSLGVTPHWLGLQGCRLVYLVQFVMFRLPTCLPVGWGAPVMQWCVSAMLGMEGLERCVRSVRLGLTRHL